MGELTIGFVGLGNMGWPMAANLHAAGFPLVVRDAAADRQLAFSGAHPGAVAAGQPGAFAVADIVVTMLPDGAVVADALLNWGIAAALAPGALVVEMSSADPSDTRKHGGRPGRRGVRMVDAPVSGGVPRAVTGELSLMVGGDDADVARAQPVLRVLGDPARQFRTGALGTGHAMKALNNVVAAATTCVTAEALVVGRRFGLDPKTMVDIDQRVHRPVVRQRDLRFRGADRPLRHRLRARPARQGRANRAQRRRRGRRGRPGDRVDRRALGRGPRRARPGRRPVEGASGLVGG